MRWILFLNFILFTASLYSNDRHFSTIEDHYNIEYNIIETTECNISNLEVQVFNTDLGMLDSFSISLSSNSNDIEGIDQVFFFDSDTTISFNLTNNGSFKDFYGVNINIIENESVFSIIFESFDIGRKLEIEPSILGGESCEAECMIFDFTSNYANTSYQNDTVHFDFNEPLNFDLEVNEIICFEKSEFENFRKAVELKNISGGIPNYFHRFDVNDADILLGFFELEVFFFSPDNTEDRTVTVTSNVQDSRGCKGTPQVFEIDLIHSKTINVGTYCGDENSDPSDDQIILTIPETIRTPIETIWLIPNVESVIESDSSMAILETDKLYPISQIISAQVFYDSSCSIQVDFKVNIVTVENSIIYDVTNLEVDFQPFESNGINSIFWDFGDGTTSESYFPTHIYEEPGEYTVTMTIDGICGEWTDTRIITVDGLTSVQESLKSSLSIYPNPVNEILNIKSKDEVISLIEIYDFEARLLKYNKVSSDIELPNIDIAHFVPGVYFCKIFTNTGVTIRKFVKM